VAAIEAIYADPDLLGSLDEEVTRAFQAERFTVLRNCREFQQPVASGAASEDEPTDAATCAAGDAHSRLRLEESFAFATNGAYSPDLIFAINVDAIASDANPDTDAQEYRWIYVSPSMDFFEETRSNASSLRKKIAAAQESLARRIVEDLHSARHETRVTGTYWPEAKGVNFFPAQTSPGVVMRAPTKSQLIGVSEASLK